MQLKFWHWHGDKTFASKQQDIQPGPYFQKCMRTRRKRYLWSTFTFDHTIGPTFNPFFTVTLPNYLHISEKAGGKKCCFSEEHERTWKGQKRIVADSSEGSAAGVKLSNSFLTNLSAHLLSHRTPCASCSFHKINLWFPENVPMAENIKDR